MGREVEQEMNESYAKLTTTEDLKTVNYKFTEVVSNMDQTISRVVGC